MATVRKSHESGVALPDIEIDDFEYSFISEDRMPKPHVCQQKDVENEPASGQGPIYVENKQQSDDICDSGKGRKLVDFPIGER